MYATPLTNEACKDDLKIRFHKRIKEDFEQPKITFQIENKFEGIVLRVEGENIFSRITDVSDEGIYEFDFTFEQILNDDKELVEEGALFNFYLGYSLSNKGKTKKKDKMIKFRRRKTRIDKVLDKMLELNIQELIEIR